MYLHLLQHATHTFLGMLECMRVRARAPTHTHTCQGQTHERKNNQNENIKKQKKKKITSYLPPQNLKGKQN